MVEKIFIHYKLMPRTRRLNLSGGLYHLIGRGIERRNIFLDDADRKRFLTGFQQSLKKVKAQCFAWALMPNHYHLLVRLGPSPLSDLMRGLLTGYAGYFNRRHGRVGHVFQNRYKSILCQEDSYLRVLVRYIHLNPLRSRIVQEIVDLDEFLWTGHSAILGKTQYDFQNIEEVLSCFGSTQKIALSAYYQFMQEGAHIERCHEFTGGGLLRSAGGWEKVRILKQQNEQWKGDERILGDGDFVNNVLKTLEELENQQKKLKEKGWSFDRIAEEVCKEYSIHRDDLANKGRNNKLSYAKALICYRAKQELGLKLSEIAEKFGLSSAAIAKNVKLGREILRKKAPL